MRHLAQRLRMEGETFMNNLLAFFRTAKVFDYTGCSLFRPVKRSLLDKLWGSQNEGFCIGDSH